MTKKDFIALADTIKKHNQESGSDVFYSQQLETLADFCEQQNPQFDRERWLNYIAGTHGPGGGKVK